MLIQNLCKRHLHNYPGTTILTLLDKVKNREQRLFYIEQAVKNNWSRNVMVNQIESNLFSRKGAAVTNFKGTLPPV